MTQIFCPQCWWKPHTDDIWKCEPGCGHCWNHFDTRGQCPQCRQQWQRTQCLSCDTWSPHFAWYHEDPGEIGRLARLLEPEKLAPE